MRHTLAARALPALVPSTFRLPASADPDRVTHPALTAVPVAFLSAPPSDASAREPAGKPALRPRADAMRPVPGTFTFDLTRGPRQLAMTVPQAYRDGKPIEGDFRIDLRATGNSKSLRLLDGTAIMAGRTRPVYPPAGLEQPTASLSVRESPDGPRTAIPRDRWRFAHEADGTVQPDDAHIWCEDGFKAGEIYELVYRTGYCPVAGLGMAAVRDFVSYLRDSPAQDLGVAPLNRALGMGVSQTGRFLRQYLHDGFNVDESGRQVFDGLFIHIAGGRTGEFNHRFAQPNEALAAGFADIPPRAWRSPSGGLLDRQDAWRLDVAGHYERVSGPGPGAQQALLRHLSRGPAAERV